MLKSGDKRHEHAPWPYVCEKLNYDEKDSRRTAERCTCGSAATLRSDASLRSAAAGETERKWQMNRKAYRVYLRCAERKDEVVLDSAGYGGSFRRGCYLGAQPDEWCPDKQPVA
ncbi:uncharacterized protein LOC112552863 [Pogonomyrmex barbatus]|uniref:Uncharacterized protein LOC112552863 n=1 Tax=Pogonomyrmex barbatus TaxID=144034 RepID=A0A8N1S7W5_9HYME|nr:uncharacterized protein LOC112552863 [Pogonomyrmex barbatus]